MIQVPKNNKKLRKSRSRLGQENPQKEAEPIAPNSEAESQTKYILLIYKGVPIQGNLLQRVVPSTNYVVVTTAVVVVTVVAPQHPCLITVLCVVTLNLPHCYRPSSRPHSTRILERDGQSRAQKKSERLYYLLPAINTIYRVN